MIGVNPWVHKDENNLYTHIINVSILLQRPICKFNSIRLNSDYDTPCDLPEFFESAEGGRPTHHDWWPFDEYPEYPSGHHPGHPCGQPGQPCGHPPVTLQGTLLVTTKVIPEVTQATPVVTQVIPLVTLQGTRLVTTRVAPVVTQATPVPPKSPLWSPPRASLGKSPRASLGKPPRAPFTQPPRIPLRRPRRSSWQPPRRTLQQPSPFPSYIPCSPPPWDWNLPTGKWNQHHRHLFKFILKGILLNKNHCILVDIRLKFVSRGTTTDTSSLVQIKVWRNRQQGIAWNIPDLVEWYLNASLWLN